jgi:hypothetical protein
MTHVLKAGYKKGNIKKVLRLGKKDRIRKPKPLPPELSDGRVENLVMENAVTLNQAKR